MTVKVPDSLPWRQHLVDDTTIVDRDGRDVAHTTPEGYGLSDAIDFSTDTENCEAVALYIVNACNAHPGLVKALDMITSSVIAYLSDARPRRDELIDKVIYAVDNPEFNKLWLPLKVAGEKP